MIRSPLEFFGVEPGSDRTLIIWDKVVDYFCHLDENSPRIKVVESGKTTLGNTFIYAIVTSEENMARLDEYKQISRTLADPKGLSEAEIKELCERGKAVYVQTHSLHSSEPGGTQMCISLAHELVTSDEEEIKNIRDNVITILVPCANPDGQIMVTEWYERSLGTPWEGMRFPGMYHIYARHCNNRDFVHENLIETRYLNDITERDWMPQVLLDHHQQIWDENRISVPPCVNPNWPELSPLLTREEQTVGYRIARDMEEDGFVGVVAGDSWYNTYPIYSLAHTCAHANVLGLLAETADARLASPADVPREKLWRYTKKSAECPTPFEGGTWTFPDVVRYMRRASLSVLTQIAEDKTGYLRRRAKKAAEQIARGAKSNVKGYLIPRDQHDTGVLARLITILEQHKIEYSELSEPYTENGVTYPVGTYYVSLAQARYSLAALIFTSHPYPICPETVWEDGTVHVFDSSSTVVTAPMGIRTVKCQSAPTQLRTPTPVVLTTNDIMPACENDSFKKANALLTDGKKVYRNAVGDFLTEAEEGAKEIKRARVAILSPSKNLSGFMGYARLAIENFGFDPYIISDKEVRAGALRDHDILVLAGYTRSELEAGDTLADGMPEEYRSGLGKDGKEELKKFVSRGGRIVAWDKSCIYLADLFALPITDMTGAKGGIGGLYDANKEYISQGSILNISCKKHALTRGMPTEFKIKHNSGPAYEPTDGSVEIIARHKTEDCFEGGLIIGEELIRGHASVLQAKVGKGELVLYTFDPFYRAQADGTFKLVFNALYIE